MPKHFVDLSLNFEPTCVSDVPFMNSFNPVEICLLVDKFGLAWIQRQSVCTEPIIYFFSFHCLLSRIICPCCGLTSKVKYHPQKRVYCLLRLCKLSFTYSKYSSGPRIDPWGTPHSMFNVFFMYNSISTYCFLFNR